MTQTLFGPLPQSMDFRTASEDALFAYYRKAGFPNYNQADYSVTAELRKVRSADATAFFNGEKFKKYQAANGFLFSYFPHWIDVQCGDSPTLREAWNDDALLHSLLKKTRAFCDKHGEGWSTNRLRQNAKVYCAKQSVSNFNPVCARILYDRFASRGVVYDMSMGWGGRLLGFHASSARLYIGCEPSTKTFSGLRHLQADLSAITRKDAILLPLGSEAVNLTAYTGQVDFAFTSPPYFDTEKYANEPTQSYIAFPTLERWLDGFLRPTIVRAAGVLRRGGVLAINYTNAPSVTIPLVRFAEDAGLRLESVLGYELSSIAGGGAKYEPIFVFRKGDDDGSTNQGQLSLF